MPRGDGLDPARGIAAVQSNRDTPMSDLGAGLLVQVGEIDEETAFYREGEEWSIAQVLRHLTFDLARQTASIDAMSRGRQLPPQTVSGPETAQTGTLDFKSICARYESVRGRLRDRLNSNKLPPHQAQAVAATVKAHEAGHVAQIQSLLSRAPRAGPSGNSGL
jgi:hypothetical protein